MAIAERRVGGNPRTADELIRSAVAAVGIVATVAVLTGAAWHNGIDAVAGVLVLAAMPTALAFVGYWGFVRGPVLSAVAGMGMLTLLTVFYVGGLTTDSSTASLAFASLIPLLWATFGAAALASRLLASRRGRPGAARA
ncbi:MAG: hypothetical protein M5T61_02500 [Acidimicrobiia bacterium]|nr:hypothetical protein [Acidimicrobiia bacterium]